MDWNLGEQQDTGHTATRKVQDWFRSDSESAEECDFEAGDAWPCREDQYEIMTGASRSMRLVSYWWLYDLCFQSLINYSNGRVHVNLYLDFIRAYPQQWQSCSKKENFHYDGIIFAVKKWKLIANQN